MDDQQNRMQPSVEREMVPNKKRMRQQLPLKMQNEQTKSNTNVHLKLTHISFGLKMPHNLTFFAGLKS